MEVANTILLRCGNNCFCKKFYSTDLSLMFVSMAGLRL